MPMKKMLTYIKNINWKEVCHKTLPYIILFVASVLPFIIWFKIGGNITTGDDTSWHQMWPWDLAEGWRNGFLFRVTPSHNLLGNLGLGTYLFYGPLCHIFVASLNFIGFSINTSLKIVTILSFWTSSIWTYHLAKRIGKDDVLALMIALIWTFVPYRIYNILYRGAYPEAIAMGFMPLLFLGVHQLGQGDFRPNTFLKCIFGVSCLVLSHPYTSIISIGFAFIYLLASYKGMIALFKNWKALIYSGVSAVLIIFLVGWYVFPMMHYLKSGIYLISDSQLMWTNVPHIQDSINQSGQFSGFLNRVWLEVKAPGYGFPNVYNETWGGWILDYFIVAGFGIAGLLAGYLSSKKLNKFLSGGIAATTILFAMIPTNRPEVRIIVPLLSVLLFFVFAKDDAKDSAEILKNEIETFKEPGLYVSIVIIIAASLLVWSSGLWEILPSIMLNAQFAWRNWSLFAIGLIILLAFLLPLAFRKKIISGLAAIAVALLFISNMGIIDKRFVYANNEMGREEPSITMVEKYHFMGAQDEYAPAVFRDSTYVSEYDNSLYKEVRGELYHGKPLHFGINDYITPVFLEGTGTIEITSLNSPEATFTVNVTSNKALIQFPQFFYDGYELQYDKNHVKGVNIDGLVSFEVTNGNYSAKLKWVGITSQKMFTPLLYVGLVGCITLPLAIVIVNKVAKKKEVE